MGCPGQSTDAVGFGRGCCSARGGGFDGDMYWFCKFYIPVLKILWNAETLDVDLLTGSFNSGPLGSITVLISCFTNSLRRS